MNLDWAIVGGGIHGVHLAARLLGEVGVPRDALRLVDPGEELLAQWRTRTGRTGMTHLRSPSVHHLDLHPASLRRFAGRRKRRPKGLFARPYDRPALGFFNRHCDDVVERFGLKHLHLRDCVVGFSVECDAVSLTLGSGQTLVARNVVLAIGDSNAPRLPEWFSEDDERVQHVFAPGFDGWPTEASSVAVVGGGISAGQIALRLIEEGHEVHLLARHPLRKSQFDSDPGWLGPKFMSKFARESCLDARRAMVAGARRSGSVPPDLLRALERAIERGDLGWHQSEVERLDGCPDQLSLTLNGGELLHVERVLLATGLVSRRPGGPLVDDLVEAAALPCASCGYPIVGTDLRWHSRIVVSGALAELELGPAARNIAGARRAGDRIVDSLRHIRR